jgi:hypothetical protein
VQPVSRSVAGTPSPEEGEKVWSNPFAEVSEADHPDAEFVEQAQHGNRATLEKLVLRHQAWIYHNAIRITFHPQDAEEVTRDVGAN